MLHCSSVWFSGVGAQRHRRVMVRLGCLLCAITFIALGLGAGFTEAARPGSRMLADKQRGLPPGVCYWQQRLVGDEESSGSGDSASNCTFEVRHEDFLAILGPSPVLKFEAAAAAHEGGVYYPDKNEFFFTTKRVENTKLQKLHLDTKEVTTVQEETDFANGLVLDNQGQLVVCQQGQIGSPGHIDRVDPETGKVTTSIANNWFNIPFNSPNDVVVKSDNSIWFTDPDYGSIQGFTEKPRVDAQVYRIDPKSGAVDVVADGFAKPNGLAFSPDEKLLYVTDSGYAVGNGSVDIKAPHSVTVFKVTNDRFLTDRSFFTAVARYDGSGLGIPDGIKVDTRGNVYIATGDGVQVFNKYGLPLGLIRVPGAANMGFAGPRLDTLYILDDVAIQSVKLKATGAGLAYAAKYHHLAI